MHAARRVCLRKCPLCASAGAARGASPPHPSACVASPPACPTTTRILSPKCSPRPCLCAPTPICSASPHTLATLLYGLAALGHRPPPAFFTAFYRATAAAMRRAPARAKAAAAVSGKRSGAAARGGGAMTGRGIARMLWALATLGKDPPGMWLAL